MGTTFLRWLAICESEGVAAYLFPLIILSGVLQAFGNSMNAQLKASLLNPWLASTISFLVVLPIFAIIFMLVPRPLPTGADIMSMPWWAPLGGLAGSVAVLLGLLFVNKVGAGVFNGSVIAANVVASLAIDHWGLLKMPVHPITPLRFVGGVLMVGGIFMISRF